MSQQQHKNLLNLACLAAGSLRLVTSSSLISFLVWGISQNHRIV